MSIDKAVQVRQEDALNAERIGKFISDYLPEFPIEKGIEILQFPSGASNLTYELKLGRHSLILRTSPKGANIKSAHDMGREYRVLSSLIEHFPYCPKPIAYSEDNSILGRPFYIMEKIEGIIPRRKMPVKLSDQQCHELCKNLIKVQLQLHAIDITDNGLIDLGKPNGYVSRQVTGWCKRYQGARTDDVPKADGLMTWLIDNQPEDSYSRSEQASFIHNDYKLDNIVLNVDEPTEIISVLDWEMSTVGDPLMDLGCSLAYWVEAGDSQALQQIRMMPTHLPGMMTRDQLVDYYMSQSDRTVNNFNYYYVFGLFRLAVIVQQIYRRYKQGHTTNERFANFGSICSILIAECEQYY